MQQDSDTCRFEVARHRTRAQSPGELQAFDNRPNCDAANGQIPEFAAEHLRRSSAILTRTFQGIFEQLRASRAIDEVESHTSTKRKRVCIRGQAA
jgi:hypothetical protein